MSRDRQMLRSRQIQRSLSRGRHRQRSRSRGRNMQRSGLRGHQSQNRLRQRSRSREQRHSRGRTRQRSWSRDRHQSRGRNRQVASPIRRFSKHSGGRSRKRSRSAEEQPLSPRLGLPSLTVNHQRENTNGFVQCVQGADINRTEDATVTGRPEEAGMKNLMSDTAAISTENVCLRGAPVCFSSFFCAGVLLFCYIYKKLPTGALKRKLVGTVGTVKTGNIVK